MLFGAAGPAAAHEFWLAPSSYRAGPRDTLAVGAFVGTGFRGEARPYAAPRAKRFTVEAGRRDDLRPGVTSGERTWALLLPRDGAGQLIAYESDYAFISLPAERFDAYLAEEGLEDPLAARRALGPRAGNGRERYMRCAKTWVAGRQSRRVTRPQGLDLEIVPLVDPSGATRLPLRVLYRGRPLANALVRAWVRPLESGAVPFDAAHRDSVGLAHQVRTKRDGTALVDVGRPGEWLVNVVHMSPSEDPRQAEWQSVWSSLTFARLGSSRAATARP